MLALDIGGTHVSAGSVDVATAAVRDRVRLELPQGADREGLLRPISEPLAAVDGGAVDYVGVAVPAPSTTPEVSRCSSTSSSPYTDRSPRRSSRASLGQPVDRLRQRRRRVPPRRGLGGGGRRPARAVGVTLGTGLGSAFLDGAQIVDTGPTVPPEGSLHLLRHRARPVEDLVSRAALIAAYGDPRLDVRDLARDSLAAATSAPRGCSRLATALGEVLAPWVVSFGATCLVVGGSISPRVDLLAPSLRAELRGVAPLRTIAPAAHLDDVALLGAARAAVAARTAAVGSGP